MLSMCPIPVSQEDNKGISWNVVMNLVVKGQGHWYLTNHLFGYNSTYAYDVNLQLGNGGIQPQGGIHSWNESWSVP